MTTWCVLDGVQRCLDALRSNPSASVAQGYSFSFLCQHDGDMDLGNILYFTPTIDDATPLARLAKLFARYQAATYGNYRTPVLQRIFDTLKPMRSILARELLGTALAAIEGPMIRVSVLQPRPQHGRLRKLRALASIGVVCEGLLRGLFSEYHHYRELMAQAVLSRPDNTLEAAAVRRVLDLIHLRYMVRHAPDGALAFIADQKMSGVPFEEYWPRPEIHQPLYETASIGTSAPATPATLVDRGRFGLERSYNLHPNFSAPLGTAAPAQTAIMDLLRSLENYQLESPAAGPTRVRAACSQETPTRAGGHGIGAAMQLQRCPISPDSLSAICTQSRLPEEVIVLDDGSTDDSLKIIEDFGRRYPFIRILKNGTNRGLLYSINRALEEARCAFVVWAAADDRLMPQFLERNVQCLREYPAAGMTFSRLAVFEDGSDETTSFTEKNYGVAFDFGTAPRFLSPQMLRNRLQHSHLWISANTAMASRTALMQAGGFDAELRWHADYFSFLAVALRHGAVCIPETLALMRQRPQTYSSEGMANRNEQRAILGRLADKLTTKGWRDLGITVLRCPSLLSPFGGLMLEALLRRPRRWPFAATYGLWWANHECGRRTGMPARIASRCARMALRAVLSTITTSGRFVRWARRT